MELIYFLAFMVFALAFIFGLSYLTSLWLGEDGKLLLDVDEKRDASNDAISTIADVNFDKADSLIELIGSYGRNNIYRFALFGNIRYQFDHILLPCDKTSPQHRSRCIAPGLVYLPLS